MNPDPLRKLHSFTGLFPLGAYLLFHAYEHVAVRAGRAALVLRLERTSHALLEVLLVLLPLLVHAALGVRLARTRAEHAPYASPAFARLQLWTGIAAALFLLLHVGGVWLPRVTEQRPAAAYGAMLRQVAHLPGALLYLLGISAVCLHFGQGLSSLLLRHGVLGLPARGARILGALVGVLLWLVFLDELSAYVSGAALL
jgi:succinate dehydrogenase / fumarate reductase cytochrome b subunit